MIATFSVVAAVLDEIDPKEPEVAVEQIEASLLLALRPDQSAALAFAALRTLPHRFFEQFTKAILASHLGHPPAPVFLDVVEEASIWALQLQVSGKRIYIAALWASMCARERNAFLVWASAQKSRVPT